MSIIRNIEKNVFVEITMKNGLMFDFNKKRSSYENWIPFKLNIKTPTKKFFLDEKVKATFTEYEIKFFLNQLEEVLKYQKNNEQKRYVFCSSENFFEMIFETIPEDNMIEVEVWISAGVRTNGEIFGFDEGVRFITDEDELSKFVVDIKKELKEILG